MVTVGLYIFLFLILIISAYRRIRAWTGLPARVTGYWMMDEQAMRQLREQGLEESERIRQELRNDLEGQSTMIGHADQSI